MNFLAQFKNGKIEFNSISRYNDFRESVGDCKIRVSIEKIGAKRSLSQNSAMHLYWSQVSAKLIEAGLDAKIVLKPEVDIPMIPELVKKLMWKPIQLARTGKEHSSDLNKNEVSIVFEIFNRHLGERFKFHIPFPSRDFVEGLDY